MNCSNVSGYIVDWLKQKIHESNQKGFVIGVSGGIDSAVVSTLCALTDLPAYVINMPIHQAGDQFRRANEHISFLTAKFKTASAYTIDLTNCFNVLAESLVPEARGELALVNTRSRLRMVTLYAFANSNQCLVAGTGNKIEDYGIGFFTKYGDGGVDISPIGDLLKSEVYEMGTFLGVPESILKAAPTDGLWETDRPDEAQIGASYDELEWAMNYCSVHGITNAAGINYPTKVSLRQSEVLKNYITRHIMNRHKMEMPSICTLSGIK